MLQRHMTNNGEQGTAGCMVLGHLVAQCPYGILAHQPALGLYDGLNCSHNGLSGKSQLPGFFDAAVNRYGPPMPMAPDRSELQSCIALMQV